ncbi:MAG TPA: electron transfer flavoprotein subunit alpha/FixB family protein [Anaeromyxobacter sp.]|nr:electron transfer flavoprotein subunit alpha/FixB family protein [Anaeromyxobacter sp.]
MGNVLILAEHAGGAVKKPSLHALAAARELATRTGSELHCALLGEGLSALAGELAGYGAPVHLLESPALPQPVAESLAPALERLARELGTTYLLAAATAWSKDLLPRVAARLGAGMASEVLGFGGDGPAVTFRRPMWAGNVLAEVEIATPVKVLTVRPTEFPLAGPVGAPGPVVRADPGPAPAVRARVVGFAEVRTTRPQLGDARVVVAGGRGTKGDFRAVEELADALGGAVGATRAAVDAGWVPNDWQVGQTGKVVAPDLYVAAGISGAIQHLAGMKGSRVIVAINKDPEAPIFQVADYGLVADLFQVLPALVARVKAGR